MFEVPCAVLAITIIGLAWHIWRPILQWASIIAVILVVLGGVFWSVFAAIVACRVIRSRPSIVENRN